MGASKVRARARKFRKEEEGSLWWPFHPAGFRMSQGPTPCILGCLHLQGQSKPPLGWKKVLVWGLQGESPMGVFGLVYPNLGIGMVGIGGWGHWRRNILLGEHKVRPAPSTQRF